MMQISGSDLTQALLLLDTTLKILRDGDDAPIRPGGPMRSEQARSVFDAFLQHWDKVGIGSPALGDHAAGIRLRPKSTPVAVLLALVEGFRDCFYVELTSQRFFYVPVDRQAAYLDPKAWFGEQAVDRFPGIWRDVRDACQCYAFGQWTAAVFHAMRVLERGLRIMARRHGVQWPGLEQWEKLIRAIEQSVQAIIQQPKTTHRQKMLQADSEAALQFRHFKDALRNHVSHANADYDEQEAERILAHVKDFMRALAKSRR